MGHTFAHVGALALVVAVAGAAGAGPREGGVAVTLDGGLAGDAGAALLDGGAAPELRTSPDAGVHERRARPREAAPDAGLSTEAEKALYALGFSLGGGVSGFDLSPRELDIVIRGLTDSVRERAPAVPVQEYATQLRDLHQERRAAQAQKERARSRAFLIKAAADRRALKLQSGLIYKDVRRGTGATPAATDRVRVHYRGTLIDGEEFDSSYTRGGPAEFALESVIPCWKEALLRMRVGGAARIVCPSELAYGDRGVPPDIPGGAALVFDVELLEILPGSAAAPPDGGTP